VLSRPDPRDPFNEQNVPDFLGQPLIDTVPLRHDYDLRFSACDMIFLTTCLKKNDARVHSWGKLGANYKEWKPLHGVVGVIRATVREKH
jgi:hypothetical protein